MALSDFRPMQERCSTCVSCKWIPMDKVKSVRFGESCPSIGYYNFMTYSARGKFQLGQTILDGDADYDEEGLRAVTSCLSCGACDVGCKICRYNLEPLAHNIEIKNDAIIKGHILPEQKNMIDSLKNEQTLIPGAKKANRLDWAKGLDLKNALKEETDVLFFAGCKYSYDERLLDAVRGGAELLIDSGVKVGTLGEAECCCGGRAYQMGFYDEFNERADANIQLIKKSGVKLIVTPCSDCYHAFKRLYAERGLDVEVLHIVEYIDRLISEGKIKFTKNVDLTVTYHDPCHLGRLGEPYEAWNGHEKKIRNQIHTWEPRRPRYNGANGIYDAPRRIINAIPGIKLVEMERIREYSWCCGAGGGCSETDKDMSSWAASERVLEANSTGAEAMITACPWCESNFSGVQDENGKTIDVIDIIDLVRRAM